MRLALLVACLPVSALAGILSVDSPSAAALVTPHRIDVIAENLTVPWELRFLPDDTQIFTERSGRVRLIRNLTLLPEPALVLPVAQGNKMGLLGLAVAPDFNQSAQVFLAWNKETERDRFELRVERYRLADDKLVEPKVLIEGIRANRNHTGCRLEFGPDGMLFLTTGDADDSRAAQDLGQLHGKILRLDPSAEVPQDNPFVAQEGARPEIWSYGHRNPQGLAFQPSTGRLFASEHGPLHGDELNRIERGANYGWPVITHRREAEDMVSPLMEISPAVGPGRLLFYQGSQFPELRGTLLMATLRGESVFRIVLGGRGDVAGVDRLWAGQWGRIRFINEAPDGSLWLGTSQQDPPEGQPRDDDDRILRIAADPQGRVEDAEEGPALGITLNARTRDPRQLIAAACAACHGSDLAGVRPLVGVEWKHVTAAKDLENIIFEGLPDVGMPPADGLLTEQQVGIIADYLRELRGEN